MDDLKLQLAEIKKEMNNKKITEEIELEGNSIDVSELFSNSLDLWLSSSIFCIHYHFSFSISLELNPSIFNIPPKNSERTKNTFVIWAKYVTNGWTLIKMNIFNWAYLILMDS